MHASKHPILAEFPLPHAQTEPVQRPLKVVNWNVGGQTQQPVIESLQQIIKAQQPDVILLQEAEFLCGPEKEDSKDLGNAINLDGNQYKLVRENGFYTLYNAKILKLDSVWADDKTLQKDLRCKFRLRNELENKRVDRSNMETAEPFVYIQNVHRDAKATHPSLRDISDPTPLVVVAGEQDSIYQHVNEGLPKKTEIHTLDPATGQMDQTPEFKELIAGNNQDDIKDQIRRLQVVQRVKDIKFKLEQDNSGNKIALILQKNNPQHQVLVRWLEESENHHYSIENQYGLQKNNMLSIDKSGDQIILRFQKERIGCLIKLIERITDRAHQPDDNHQFDLFPLNTAILSLKDEIPFELSQEYDRLTGNIQSKVKAHIPGLPKGKKPKIDTDNDKQKLEEKICPAECARKKTLETLIQQANPVVLFKLFRNTLHQEYEHLKWAIKTKVDHTEESAKLKKLDLLVQRATEVIEAFTRANSSEKHKRKALQQLVACATFSRSGLFSFFSSLSPFEKQILDQARKIEQYYTKQLQPKPVPRNGLGLLTEPLLPSREGQKIMDSKAVQYGGLGGGP